MDNLPDGCGLRDIDDAAAGRYGDFAVQYEGRAEQVLDQLPRELRGFDSSPDTLRELAIDLRARAAELDDLATEWESCEWVDED